jgi:hypothetical protein
MAGEKTAKARIDGAGDYHNPVSSAFPDGVMAVTQPRPPTLAVIEIAA